MEPSSREQATRIGFLGFGEAARCFAGSLIREQSGIAIAAWDVLLDDAVRSEAMREAMATHDAEILSGLNGFDGCRLIFSAVTASQCLNAVQSVARYLHSAQAVIDINSVAPGIKRQAAEIVGAYGAAYLDMAVMAPVHPMGHSTPVCVAGQTVEALWPVLEDIGFKGQVVGAEPGAATAIKMVRSLFVKGLEAVTVEALLAAEASGCLDVILASLSESYPGLGWPRIASYHFDRLISHGKRRSEEMMMSGDTLDALGLNGDLARQIAVVHERTYAAGGDTDRPLSDLVAETLKRRMIGVGR